MMRFRNPCPRWSAAAWVLAALPGLRAPAHEHLAAGALTSEAGAALLFVNAANFAAESGYVVPLTESIAGPYAGWHHAELAFVCQAATPDFGGPAPFHPVLGARIEAVIETIDGPAGGRFGFWETPGDAAMATELTFDLPVGTTDGTSRFPVSENDGAPGADPYGHIHGRVFSGSLPGLYRIGFRFVDTSANGPGGGPLHPPSPRYALFFQAGITIASVADLPSGPEVTFAAVNDHQYVLEASPELGAGALWTPVGEPVTGDNRLHRLQASPVTDLRFYRLRRDPL
ncbi:MAG: hypothetical protein KF791_19660 [Verrucomicrobiae bacterium]|nr:hypothetical protein [Verrucomicrobiae bacterium]